MSSVVKETMIILGSFAAVGIAGGTTTALVTNAISQGRDNGHKRNHAVAKWTGISAGGVAAVATASYGVSKLIPYSNGSNHARLYAGAAALVLGALGATGLGFAGSVEGVEVGSQLISAWRKSQR